MIVHTLLYRFGAEIDEGDIGDFFAGLRTLAGESGLVRDFAWQQHVLLPADEHSKGMTATHIAQFSCADVPTLRKFSESAPVHDFISTWRGKIDYEAAYANHEVLLSSAEKEDSMFHTEHTVTVNANADIVYEVLADIEGYAKLFPPTESSTMLEESETHQIARLVVDVSGQIQSWVTRRDLDRPNRTISYRQLDNAAMVKYMGGQWRALPLDGDRTQLVITHDFAARPTEQVPSQEEATRLLQAAVENNSHADLAAVRDEAEKRAQAVKVPA
ncbi:aromatase/cyclase [Kibdelosporangium philippinense]|uniref:Aromatase/cyclase n=1 Tax=Kibdelosporangium philippinense TaxID=211113 RepID=A0ABS8ZBQ4_9PSEU|nr:aromatase/cyclase [Kibdelosporangium philippinense]MCE7003237.1 aromatase/cyclase [Kibdelosporangium philippinense]